MYNSPAEARDEKHTCPLCGGPNECRYGSNQPCWCTGRPVSKEALESTLGEFSMTKTCLCRSCLSRFETPVADEPG